MDEINSFLIPKRGAEGTKQEVPSIVQAVRADVNRNYVARNEQIDSRSKLIEKIGAGLVFGAFGYLAFSNPRSLKYSAITAAAGGALMLGALAYNIVASRINANRQRRKNELARTANSN